jgi:hypothetical protein
MLARLDTAVIEPDRIDPPKPPEEEKPGDDPRKGRTLIYKRGPRVVRNGREFREVSAVARPGRTIIEVIRLIPLDGNGPGQTTIVTKLSSHCNDASKESGGSA